MVGFLIGLAIFALGGVNLSYALQAASLSRIMAACTMLGMGFTVMMFGVIGYIVRVM